MKYAWSMLNFLMEGTEPESCVNSLWTNVIKDILASVEEYVIDIISKDDLALLTLPSSYIMTPPPQLVRYLVIKQIYIFSH